MISEGVDGPEWGISAVGIPAVDGDVDDELLGDDELPGATKPTRTRKYEKLW